ASTQHPGRMGLWGRDGGTAEPWGGLATADPAPQAPRLAEMKVLAAALLLLCACRLQAALVRREVLAEEATPPAEDDFFTRHFQSFSDFMTKDLAQKLQVEEAYLDRANKQLTPLAQELRSNVLGLFSSLLELGKGEGQP
uniref:Apolipoprotein A-II n=1 Tax=Aquila chrysaetos chrysaetos TaxID=223781 RepID=A0A663EMP1_AQUCH